MRARGCACAWRAVSGRTLSTLATVMVRASPSLTLSLNMGRHVCGFTGAPLTRCVGCGMPGVCVYVCVYGHTRTRVRIDVINTETRILAVRHGRAQRVGLKAKLSTLNRGSRGGMCVCVRARACVCVCVCARARVRFVRA